VVGQRTGVGVRKAEAKVGQRQSFANEEPGEEKYKGGTVCFDNMGRRQKQSFLEKEKKKKRLGVTEKVEGHLGETIEEEGKKR